MERLSSHSEAVQTEYPDARGGRERGAYRTLASVPLMRQGQPIGVLKQHLGEQVRVLDSLMNRLDDVSTESAELTVIETEGQAKLQDLLELALRCKSRQWQIIAPHANALRFMPPHPSKSQRA